MGSRSHQNHRQNKKQPIQSQFSAEDEKASLNVVKEEKLSCIALESFNPTNTQKTFFFFFFFFLFDNGIKNVQQNNNNNNIEY